MIGPLDLMLAFFVDLAIGDPAWVPHPVRLIGSAIHRCELFLRRHFAKPSEEKIAGIFLTVMIVVPAYLAAFLIQKALFMISERVSIIIGMALLVYLIATTIAVRELIASSRLVIESVKDGSLTAAREKLGRIVGRDTGGLSDREILKAVMETLAENLSDGVIAPVFYLVIGGLPLAIAYKAINTLDSMVGYRNERYMNFGWAAARIDDIANYVPARITGFIIVIAVFVVSLLRRDKNPLTPSIGAFRIMRRDGRNHTSPNSGVPEAAMAGGLGIRMGGPATYGGVVSEKPFIGDGGREDYVSASEDAIAVVKVASVTGIVLAVAALSLRIHFS